MELSKNKEFNNILKVGSKKFNLENWEVYHPNGKHMFTCGEKKAEWYLTRNLARIIDNYKIVLTFTPNGSGFEDNEDFGRNVRKNRCVVTGIEHGLQRHHIIPYCYRSHFPNEYKSKNHHDVVLINYLVHSEYEKYANEYKNEIAKIFGVKTINECNSDYVTALRDFGKSQVIILNTIYSIFKTYNKVSHKFIIEKLHFVAENSNLSFDYLSQLTYIQLYKFYLLLKSEQEKEINEFKLKNSILYDHGYQVVNKLDNEDKIIDFIKIWRKHFINTMKPKYMPDGWSVDFRTKTKFL